MIFEISYNMMPNSDREPIGFDVGAFLRFLDLVGQTEIIPGLKEKIEALHHEFVSRPDIQAVSDSIEPLHIGALLTLSCRRDNGFLAEEVAGVDAAEDVGG